MELLDLPNDVLLLILQAIPFSQKRIVPLVCRRLRQLAALPWSTAHIPSALVALLGSEHGCGKSSLMGQLLDATGFDARTATGPIAPLSHDERASGSLRALADRLAGKRTAPAIFIRRWSAAVAAGSDLTVLPDPTAHYAAWGRARATTRIGGRPVLLTATPSEVELSRTALRAAFSADVIVFTMDIRQVSRVDTVARRRLEELLTIVYTRQHTHTVLALTHADAAATDADSLEQLGEAVTTLKRLAKKWRLAPGTLIVVPVSALTGDNVVTPAAALDRSVLGEALRTLQSDDVAFDPTDADQMGSARVVVPRQYSLLAAVGFALQRTNSTRCLAKARAPVAFAIDDVFRVPGVGSVVTGTVLRGTLAVGQSLVLNDYPATSYVTVKSIQNPFTRQSITSEVMPGEYVAFAFTAVSLPVSYLTRHRLLLDKAAYSHTVRPHTFTARICVTDAAIAAAAEIRQGFAGLGVFAGGLEAEVRLDKVTRVVHATQPPAQKPMLLSSVRLSGGDVVECDISLTGSLRTLASLEPQQCFVVRTENRTVLAGRMLPPIKA